MMYQWHRADILGNFQEETITERVICGRTIAFVRKGIQIFAFAATCPHAGARFCDGWIDSGGRIVCPDHKYRFNPSNGYNTSGEGYRLKTYPVEIKEDIVYIGLHEPDTILL